MYTKPGSKYVSALISAVIVALFALTAGCSDDDDDPPSPEFGHDPALANTVWIGMNLGQFTLRARAFVHLELENGEILNGAVFMDEMNEIPPTDEEGFAEWLATVSLDDVDVYTWRTAGNRLYLAPFDPYTLVTGKEVSYEYDLQVQMTINDGSGFIYTKFMDVDDDFDYDWLFTMFDPSL